MQNPYVSVVILTTAHPKKVLECLDVQTYKNFEVIIASEQGIVNAMNNALRRCRGEIMVRVDDDVLIPTTWLESLIKPFYDPIVGGVTGPTYVPEARRKYRDSIRIAEKPNWFLRWMFDNDPYAPAKIYKCGSVSYGSNFMERIDKEKAYQIDHLEGTNWAMRTSYIRAVGGFDPKFDGVAEWFDTDVEFKIKKRGYILLYETQAWLLHLLNEGDHFRERFEGWGRIKNWLRFHIRHSKFNWKMLIWLGMMVGYICTKKR